MSRTLITAVELGCADEIVTIIAMLSVPNVFYRPKVRESRSFFEVVANMFYFFFCLSQDKAAQADQKKAAFAQPEGDHLVLLAVYQAWKHNRFSMPWASENFLQVCCLLFVVLFCFFIFLKT